MSDEVTREMAEQRKEAAASKKCGKCHTGDPSLDPQLALDALRACKQEPALATWAMAWGVKLCMAMGAK
jgi:hypothetical protein